MPACLPACRPAPYPFCLACPPLTLGLPLTCLDTLVYLAALHPCLAIATFGHAMPRALVTCCLALAFSAVRWVVVVVGGTLNPYLPPEMNQSRCHPACLPATLPCHCHALPACLCLCMPTCLHAPATPCLHTHTILPCPLPCCLPCLPLPYLAHTPLTWMGDPPCPCLAAFLPCLR